MSAAEHGLDSGRQEDRRQPVILGRISGVYGVKGWVRIFSETRPRERILDYSPWQIGRAGTWETREVKGGRRHGKGVVARLVGIEDRDAAAELIGADIAVTRSQLGDAAPGEYYWTDLEGLEVVTTDGQVLGFVEHLFETGANDVMVVKGERERLIPFVEPQIVRRVDFEGRRLVVDWDPDF